MLRRVSQGQATRSEMVIETFVATITERRHEVEEIFAAVDGDERVSQGFRTGWIHRMVALMEAPEYLHDHSGWTHGSLEHYWVEFCITHGIDGERFKALMDPVLDIWTGAVLEDEYGRTRPLTFRGIAEDSGYINLIDMIETGQCIPLKIWLKIAYYLALHPSVPTPPWMEP